MDRRERPHCPWGKKYFLLRIWSECCESTLHSRGKYVGCAPRLLPAQRPMWLLSGLVLLSLLTVVSVLILFFSLWEIIKIYKANNIEKQINVDVWPTEDLWKTIGLTCWKDSSLWSERSTLDCVGGLRMSVSCFQYCSCYSPFPVVPPHLFSNLINFFKKWNFRIILRLWNSWKNSLDSLYVYPMPFVWAYYFGIKITTSEISCWSHTWILK